MKRFILKLIKLLFGLSLMGIGMAMSKQSYLGLAPWDVLNDGASRTVGTLLGFNVTIGMASISLGLVIILIDVLLKERIGLGSLLNIFWIGTVCDLMLASGLIPSFAAAKGLEQPLPRLALCFGSMLLLSLGMSLYLSVQMGAGPRDGLMVALTRISKRPVGAVRVVVEGLALALGWFLGGTVGFGTVIQVLCGGPIMGLVFRLMRFDVKALRNQSIFETFSELRRTLAPSGD